MKHRCTRTRSKQDKSLTSQCGGLQKKIFQLKKCWPGWMSRRQEQFKVRGGCACSIDRRGGGFKFERSRVWMSARLTSRQMVNKPARNWIRPPTFSLCICICILVFDLPPDGEQARQKSDLSSKKIFSEWIYPEWSWIMRMHCFVCKTYHWRTVEVMDW